MKDTHEEGLPLIEQSKPTSEEAPVMPARSKMVFLILSIILAVLSTLQLAGLHFHARLRDENPKEIETSTTSAYGKIVGGMQSVVQKAFNIGTQAPAASPVPAVPQLPVDCETPPHVILGEPTAESIVVKLLSAVEATFFIDYAINGAADAEVVRTEMLNISPSLPVAHTLKNLKPSTRYGYRIAFQNGPSCLAYTTDYIFFHTQRFVGEDYTFAIIADTHFDDPGAYEEEVFISTLSHMVDATKTGQGYDFMVDLGDTFMGLKLEPPKDQAYLLYENAFRRYSPVACSTPLFLVNGNHDGELGSFIPFRESQEQQDGSKPVNFARLRNKYFVNPKPSPFYAGNSDTAFPAVGDLRNYYAFHWGNALMITLDPYWYTLSHVHTSPWEWTLGIGQYNWLHSVLDLSFANLKFIFIHQYVGGIFGTDRGFDGNGDETYSQYFEWGGLDMDGTNQFLLNRPGWEHGPIHEMFVKHSVSVVFRGHDHLFYVGNRDGVIYNTLPKPSVADSTFHSLDATRRGYNPDRVYLTSGHTEVAVSKIGAVITLKSYENNAILHQYSVAAK